MINLGLSPLLINSEYLRKIYSALLKGEIKVFSFLFTVLI